VTDVKQQKITYVFNVVTMRGFLFNKARVNIANSRSLMLILRSQTRTTSSDVIMRTKFVQLSSLRTWKMKRRNVDKTTRLHFI
jgi:hypothetical protein